MTTSGTSSFNLDLVDLFEEAYERCGREMRSGYEARTARRSLNLLTIEWANRGINLWTIEQGQIPMYVGQGVYALPTDTIDLLDHVVRTGTGTGQVDININRISESTYSTLPNKNARGRPIQVWINRQTGDTDASTSALGAAIGTTDTTIPVTTVATLPSVGFVQIDNEIIGYTDTSTVGGAFLLNCTRGQANTIAATHALSAAVSVKRLPSINVWPTPDQGTAGAAYYTFVYWRMRRMQDASSGAQTVDIPFRFIECMVAGLAYKIAMKLPDVDPARVLALKTEYEQQFALAAEEDRDKANARFVPRIGFR